MSKSRRPDPDDDFEIVDDEPVRPKKPKVRVVEDDDEEPVRPRKTNARVIEDDEEPVRPRKAKARVVEDDDADDEEYEELVRPKRKKKKKKRAGADVPDEEPPANEWIIPLVLAGAGLIMTIIGTFGIARHPDVLVNGPLLVTLRIVGQLIAIPITIGALILIGTVFGIEYGTLASTIRNLAAMGFFVGGLTDIFDWLHVPYFICQPIIFVIGLGLFMSLFSLDANEAMVTMGGLGILSFLLKLAMFIVLMMLLHKGMNKGFDRPDKDPPPGWVDPNDDDPDDGDDPLPKPKGKGKRPKGNNPNPRPPVMPVDPDD